MRKQKWIVALVLSGGTMFAIGSCLSDLAYYATNAFVTDLSDNVSSIIADSLTDSVADDPNSTDDG